MPGADERTWSRASLRSVADPCWRPRWLTPQPTVVHSPVTFDVGDDKHGDVVKRLLRRIKNWRALASRLDKLAVVLRGSVVVLAAIVDWLRW